MKTKIAILLLGAWLLSAQQPVLVVGNPTVFSNQLAVTGTAQALSSSTPIKNICVKALAANAINVYVGPSGVTDSTGMELAANQAICMPTNNVANLYVIASTTGASVSWIATN